MGRLKHFRRGRQLFKRLTGSKDLDDYQVQVSCPKERHGTEYGGWTICPTSINQEAIVYSFGVGEDISFDLSIIEEFGVQVYAFDPTPKSIKWLKSQKLPREFKFSEYGIASYDGIASFNPPENPEHVSYTILNRPSTAHNAIEAKVYRLETIMNMLGHEKVDVLKMDIEGAEYEVIEDLVKSDIQIGQLLVEFHHRFENVGVSKTRRAIKSLNEKGFKIFYISPDREEYSFIHQRHQPSCLRMVP